MRVYKRYTFDPKTGTLTFPPKLGELNVATEVMGALEPSGDLVSIVLEGPFFEGFDIHAFVRRTWPTRPRWHKARFPAPMTIPADGLIPERMEWSVPEDPTQQKPRVPRN